MGEIVCDGQRKETKFIHKSAKTKQYQRSILKGFTRSLHYYKTAKESVWSPGKGFVNIAEHMFLIRPIVA